MDVSFEIEVKREAEVEKNNNRISLSIVYQ
jgi:hypothetical protein